jgi:hypothetical protein
VQLVLNQDGTFAFTLLVKTSTVTADEYLQKGTFALSGGNITFTPTEASCNTPLTPSVDGYVFNGQGLQTTDSNNQKTNYVKTSPQDIGAGLTLVVGCGNPWTPVAVSGTAPAPGAAPIVQPSLTGTYAVTVAPTTTQIVLNADGTYQLTQLVATSTVTGDEYIEKGLYVTSGADITFTPQQASCPVKKPITMDAYAINGVLIALITPTTGIGLARTAPTQLGAGLTLVVGCSPSPGSPFMPEPVAPVSN